jgi:predicted nucleic acid-binding protein
VLIHPLRLGNVSLADKYRDLLLGSANFATVPVDAKVAERGAELAVTYNLRLPDALQVGAALEAGCEALLTNDFGLRRVVELRILVLDDLEL